MRYTKLETGTKEPVRKHEQDAGLDIAAYGDYLLYPFSIGLIHTGLAVEIPKNCMGWITNKSSSNFLVGAGVVDEGYQGELIIKVFNCTDSIVEIKNGEFVAQLIILPILKPEIREVTQDEFYSVSTKRASSGGIHERA